MAHPTYSGYHYPRDVIQRAVWMYLRFTLSYRDVEDLLAERGIEVSYETVQRWVEGSRLRSGDRAAATGAASEAALPLASGRDVRPDRRSTDVPVAGRRKRDPGPLDSRVR